MSTLGVTPGIDPPSHAHIRARGSNSVEVEWKGAVGWGMYQLVGYNICWREVEEEGGELMSSREKVVALRNRTSGVVKVRTYL